jgi:hypothetical protein
MAGYRWGQLTDIRITRQTSRPGYIYSAGSQEEQLAGLWAICEKERATVIGHRWQTYGTLAQLTDL